MANNKNNINDSGLRKLCSFITLAATQGNIIDNLNIADDKVFSSKRVKDLIDNASEQDKLYVDKIISNLNKLSSKVVTTIPDSSTGEPNTLCLYSATGVAPFHQYLVLSDKTVIDLGSTDISLDGYLLESDAENTYQKKIDSHSHDNKSALDNITQELINNINNLKVEVDGTSYTQDMDGKIILPNYPVPRTDDEILAVINKEGLKFIDDANDTALTNGRYATKTTTTNLPVSAYGILTIDKYKDTNSTWIKQTYKPLADQIYVRSKINELEWTTWDRLATTKDNNIKTYTSLSQLGLTEGSETLLDIAQSLPEQSVLNYIVSGSSNTSQYPSKDGMLIVNCQGKWRVNFTFFRDQTGEQYVAQYNINSGVSSWKKVCTTAISDVPWTQLTMNSGVSGNVRYRVKNGICYVIVSSLKSSTMSTSGSIMTSGLPVPEVTNDAYYTLIANDYTKGSLLITIKDTGKMYNHIGVDNASYYGYFSYPVKES